MEKQVNVNRRGHILSTKKSTLTVDSFFLSMAVEEVNKLQYWSDVSIVVTKRSKFRSKSTAFFVRSTAFFVFKLLHRCKQCLINSIHIYWLGSFLIFSRTLITCDIAKSICLISLLFQFLYHCPFLSFHLYFYLCLVLSISLYFFLN